ncbi:spore protease YyaC [Shimazuella alba]|jgi:putative sporulation protein YyaC|uniref:Spore protease YyaC n=1 Tax=Shimazuella alba TaxID=2690964 RepID=A0A6I4VRL9_9BACL|nr:spore protease YyaC [Shimazuella alba]MXQ53068.1 spore protease YyaC [Shimazuella alba]
MNQTNSYSISHTNPEAKLDVTNSIISVLQEFSYQKIVCVCIGTDRSTGDSLGPLVGTFLSQHESEHFAVLGTLEEPVHALNLPEKISYLQRFHPQSLIIAIDACLGKLNSVGSIQVGIGPIRPGAGVNKQLPEVGQIHVTGIVNVAGFMEYMVLQNTRLSTVMRMAQMIADSIVNATQLQTVQGKWPQEI